MKLVSATGRQALGEMRRLVSVLRSPGPPGEPAGGDPVASPGVGDGPGPPGAELMPQPGLGDLDGLVDRVRTAGLRVTVVRSGVPGRWGPAAGLAVYRIVQEALTNTLKHAGPEARAEVRLRFDAGRVQVEVYDDGAGRAASAAEGAGRHGIAGMIERASAYGGAVTAGPRDGRAGWAVHAHLSFDDEEPAGEAIEPTGAAHPPPVADRLNDDRRPR